MNLPMFLRKIVTVKTIEELIQFIDFAGSVHRGDFSYPGFVIGIFFYSFLWYCTLYTEISISAYWLS